MSPAYKMYFQNEYKKYSETKTKIGLKVQNVLLTLWSRGAWLSCEKRKKCNSIKCFKTTLLVRCSQVIFL